VSCLALEWKRGLFLFTECLMNLEVDTLKIEIKFKVDTLTMDIIFIG